MYKIFFRFTVKDPRNIDEDANPHWNPPWILRNALSQTIDTNFSAVLQFRFAYYEVTDARRFESAPVRWRTPEWRAKLSETALHSRLSVRGLRSFMRAREARTNGRFVNANFTPHSRWLTRFRWFLFCHGYALPFRGAIVRASLRESTRVSARPDWEKVRNEWQSDGSKTKEKKRDLSHHDSRFLLRTLLCELLWQLNWSIHNPFCVFTSSWFHVRSF